MMNLKASMMSRTFFRLFLVAVVLVIEAEAVGHEKTPFMGEAKLDLDAFVKILESHPAPDPKPATPPKLPQRLSANFVMLDVDVNGSVDASLGAESMAQIHHSFQIQVFQDEWTFISLFSAGVITSSYIITNTTGHEVGNDVAFVNNIGSEMVMVVNKAGRYTVQTTVHRPVQVSRNLYSFEVNEKHSIGRFVFNITGSRAREISISPLAAVEIQTLGPVTSIIALTQRAQTWSVSWRDQEPPATDNAKPEEPSIPQVTVTQETLHSVAELTVQSTSNFTYELNSETGEIKELKIRVHGKGVRVIRVKGIHMDKWTPEEQEDDSFLVHITLKRAVYGNRYQLVLVTEQTVGEVKEFSVPLFSCLNVLRHQGQIGVVKAANVEIHEVRKYGVLTAEPTELSYSLRARTSKSVLMAYTFLSPDYTIVLQKERHETTETLDSSIEHAFVQVLVAEDHSLNKVIFKITNSNRQYLRITLPDNAQAIWSVHVADEPVKPAKDESGALLIPLTSIMSSVNKVEWHSVEVVYLTGHDALGKNGTFEQGLFSVDVPVSLLSVEVLFPDHLTAKITSEDLRFVHYFSSTLPQITKQAFHRSVVNYGSQSDLEQEVILSDYREETVGNVKVEVPQLGSRYRFEKLLVLGQSFSVKAVYPWPPPSAPDDGILAWLRSAARDFF